MRFWGFWWRMTALGYAFEHLAWPYQMLLVDIATMELPAKGSQVMTRVNSEHEFTQWVRATLNADISQWSPLVQAAEDRDRVFLQGYTPSPCRGPEPQDSSQHG